MTSGLTFLTALSLLVFGGPVLHGFRSRCVWNYCRHVFVGFHRQPDLDLFWQTGLRRASARRPVGCSARRQPYVAGLRPKAVK